MAGISIPTFAAPQGYTPTAAYARITSIAGDGDQVRVVLSIWHDESAYLAGAEPLVRNTHTIPVSPDMGAPLYAWLLAQSEYAGGSAA